MNKFDTNLVSVEVLIPTYNRPMRAGLQLKNLVALRGSLLERGIDLRVLVSDNQSPIQVIVPPEAKEFTVIVRPERHLPTAEENLFFGIGQTCAEYVWVLGDDDAIVQSNVLELMSLLINRDLDFVVGNSSGSLVDGSFVSSRTPCDNPVSIRSLPQFIQSTGFWFVTAGFSCLVFRRKIAVENLYKANIYFSVSRIYSHVFWLLDTFWDSRFLYFEKPMVVYGQNISDSKLGEHWEQACRSEGVFFKFIWTVGFVRHAKLLRREKKIPLGFFSDVIDQNWDTRFHHLSKCLDVFMEVLESEASKGKTICREITLEEKKEFIDFMSLEDSRLSEVIGILQPTLGSPMLKHLKLARAQLQKFSNENFFNCFFIKDLLGWSIYYFDGVYRAVPIKQENKRKVELGNISPRACSKQLVAETIFRLEEMIIGDGAIAWSSEDDPQNSLTAKEVKLIKKILLFFNFFKRIVPPSFLVRFQK